jgi:hypothetical protein
MKELEDYLYEADVALSEENAQYVAQCQYPGSKELIKRIKNARQALRYIYEWLQENTSRRCP